MSASSIPTTVVIPKLHLRQMVPFGSPLATQWATDSASIA
jgi:hypothetical protein